MQCSLLIKITLGSRVKRLRLLKETGKTAKTFAFLSSDDGTELKFDANVSVSDAASDKFR